MKTSITVKIKIPANYKADTVKMYYVPAVGDPQEIECEVIDGYVSFVVEHFSSYAIVAELESSGSVIVDYLRGIDFEHFTDWLAEFLGFIRSLDFLSVSRKIGGFAYYIFEGAKIIFL